MRSIIDRFLNLVKGTTSGFDRIVFKELGDCIVYH